MKTHADPVATETPSGKSKPAAILLNLGSPESLALCDVRSYLREFLMDERVLDINKPLRSLIVNFAILPKRPKESGAAYARIWTDEGSPLIVISRNLQKKLQERFPFPIELAMRYGNPSIPDAVKRLKEAGITDLYIMPLYPQYAMSSYETVLVRLTEELRKQGATMRTRLLEPFYNDPAYIDALVESARPAIEADIDLLLFSFHGIPERHLRKTDPSHAHCLCSDDCCENPHPAHATCYRHQCFEVARLFAEKAGIPKERYQVSFQSRLGRDPWLRPYTDETLSLLPRNGIKRIRVICPAFVSDCLETLEEIAMEGKEIFEKAGGEDFAQIPCLNEHPAWIDYLTHRIQAFADQR